MFLLRIGLGRSKGLILNHIFRGITALILMSVVVHAGDRQDLQKAAFAGDLPQVLSLLENADIDFQSKTLPTALIIASAQGHEGVVQVLLDKGANVELRANDGSTALIIASQEGHEEIVQALLDKGANVELRANDGSTALSVAKTKKIKELLTAAGATQ